MHLKPIVFLLPLMVWTLALRKAWFRRWLHERIGAVKRVYAALCVMVIAMPIALGAAAVYTERMTMGQGETVLAISAAYLHGQPMFPVAGGADDYALLYGPVTYLAYIPVMLLGGVREWTFEVWILLAFASSAVLLWYSMRRTCGKFARLTAVAFLMAFAAQHVNELWLTSGDIVLVTFSALGLWGSQCRHRQASLLIVAAAGAAMVDVKITTLFTAALPCLLLADRGRRRWGVAAGSLMLLIVLAASVYLLPRISLHNHMAILRDASRVGLHWPEFMGNVSFALPMLMPIALLAYVGQVHAREAMQAWWRRRRYFLAGLLLAIVTAIVMGSKTGSGPWHLLPFAAALAFATGELAGIVWAEQRSASLLSQTMGSLCVAMVCMLVLSAARDLWVHTRAELTPVAGLSSVPPRLAEAEVLQIMREHPGMILQMGVSDNSHFDLTYVSPVLQIGGNPLFADPTARADEDSQGVPVTRPMLEAVRACRVRLWLVPKGGRPFEKESPYYLQNRIGPRLLYPESFSQAFFASYRMLDAHYKYYDLWACSKAM